MIDVSEQCPFCEFLHFARPAPADLTWHTARVASFTPLNPVTKGHRLFVPVDHVTDAGAHPRVDRAG